MFIFLIFVIIQRSLNAPGEALHDSGNKLYNLHIRSPFVTNLPSHQNRALVATSGRIRIKAAGSSPATQKAHKSNPGCRHKTNIVPNIIEQQDIQHTGARNIVGSAA